MANADDLLRTIEAVHAAGLDETCWPAALAATAGLFGGRAAMLEVFAPPSQRPVEFHAFGIPPDGQLEYFEHYAALSPRAAYAFRNPADHLLWDYKLIDEAAMDRDPYYAKLLPQADLRYFISAKLSHTRDEIAAISVQRTRAQGHADGADIALIARLAPHFRQALDTAMRLRRTHGLGRSFEGALDWLADGVALLAKDGAVLYANSALQSLARLDDGMKIANKRLNFAAPNARDRMSSALGAALVLGQSAADGAACQDFAADRPSGAPAYLVSLRPIAGKHYAGTEAIAIVFIRDPLSRMPAPLHTLRTMFGLTEAEANLAQALHAGLSPTQYASERSLSSNTVYTHLRRLKDKTGCKRMTELIRKLNDVQVSARID